MLTSIDLLLSFARHHNLVTAHLHATCLLVEHLLAAKQPAAAAKLIDVTERDVVSEIQGGGDDVRGTKVTSSTSYILLQAMKAEMLLLQNEVRIWDARFKNWV